MQPFSHLFRTFLLLLLHAFINNNSFVSQRLLRFKMPLRLTNLMFRRQMIIWRWKKKQREKSDSSLFTWTSENIDVAQRVNLLSNQRTNMLNVLNMSLTWTMWLFSERVNIHFLTEKRWNASMRAKKQITQFLSNKIYLEFVRRIQTVPSFECNKFMYGLEEFFTIEFKQRQNQSSCMLNNNKTFHLYNAIVISLP